MAVYTVRVDNSVLFVGSLRKAKLVAGKTGIVMFPNNSLVSQGGLGKNVFPTEYAKFKKCGTLPLVRKPKVKQTNKFLLIVRERLQKLLDGVETIGTLGLCAYLTWYNDYTSNRKDDHGRQECYEFISFMIMAHKKLGYDFYELKNNSGEYDGVFGPVRREFVEKIIKLIDENKLEKNITYGYKIK